MGHIRLGPIPKSRKWQAVVEMFSEDLTSEGVANRLLTTTDIEQIATATLDAAKTGLGKAVDDRGLRYVFYLLTQLVLSARQDDWQSGLQPFGIDLQATSSVFDLTCEIQAATDEYLERSGSHSDISEIAQRSAGTAISALVTPRAVTLFGSGRDELQAAVRMLSTKAGFAELSQRFFGLFVAQYLNFYLSRITASSIADGPIQHIGDISQFNTALYTHCHQSAHIVRDFSGEWYSSTEFREGMTLDNTSRFMSVALKKLQSELKQQGADA